MVHIKKISNVLPIEKGKQVSGSQRSSSSVSPFAIKPTDPLKGIVERKSRLSEIQKLAILQRVLRPYAKEVEKKLPHNLLEMKELVRKKMIAEGFSEEVAQEASDEALTAVLEKKAS